MEVIVVWDAEVGELIGVYKASEIETRAVEIWNDVVLEFDLPKSTLQEGYFAGKTFDDIRFKLNKEIGILLFQEPVR